MNFITFYFNALSLLAAISVWMIGVVVYRGSNKDSLSKFWFLMCIFAGLWSALFFLVINSSTKELSSLIRIFLDASAILVTYFWFRFVLAFLDVSYKNILKYTSIATVAMLLLNMSPWFVTSMTPKYIFKYYVNAGWGYYIFSIYFIAIATIGLAMLFKASHGSTGTRAMQIKNILRGSVVGFIGSGSSFLLAFNIPIPPYLFILFAAFPIVIVHGIIKYNLFNLKVILVELAILLLNMFLLFNVFTSHATTDLVLNISVSTFVFLFSVVLMRGIYKDIRDRERIEGLVKEMEIANEKLRMLEGQKTEFVSIASHQLRTPLTVIKGYASMVLEGTFGAISDSVRDAMDKLYKSSERIVALVEDLLTVSRIEQGRMMLVFETINFKDLVQSVLEETQATAAEAKIDFSFTAEEGKDFFVAVDEKKFKQVVRHILDNAIKYTPAPGSVHVTVADDSLTKKVRLTISDTGIGMTPEQITAIFERFNLKIEIGEHLTQEEEEMHKGRVLNTNSQGPTLGADAGHKGPTLNTVRMHEGQTLDAGSKGTTLGSDAGKEIHEDPAVGSGAGEEARSAESKAMGDNRTPGIGLYIAQEIIEAHHGTIRIESAGPDRGTTVVVELPRAEAVK